MNGMCADTFVDDAGVELDGNGSSYDLAQEAAGISGVAGGFGCWAFAVGGHVGDISTRRVRNSITP
jgi:hypothetical protein